jgi:anaerobic magnesium-protoporphyrin IX monomethyl ester cyclase
VHANLMRERPARADYTVALVNPPSAAGTSANREGAAGLGVVYPYPAAFLYPPHTLATVAASLRQAGYRVRAMDAVVEEFAADLEADTIGIFVSYATLAHDLAFVARLRQQVSARLIAFGPAMRFVGDQVLSGAPLDAVLVGEAEGLFPAALRYLEDAHSSTPVLLTPATVQAPGYDADGFILDLDALPFPAWDLLQPKKYKLLTVLSSRGCPDRCTYCPYAAAQGHHFRARSVDSVLAELAWLQEHFRPARLIFRDPVFAHDRERVARLCTDMLSRQLHLRWECESRPEHFDRELLELMQRAGCQWIKIGLETTDAGLLHRLKRVSSAEEASAYLLQVAHLVQTCDEIGLQCRLFVMGGLPGQDVAMAEQTGSFVQRLHPTALNVKLCDRYPGTDLEPGNTSDGEAQIHILQQAQGIVQGEKPPRNLLARGTRWLRGKLPGGSRA